MERAIRRFHKDRMKQRRRHFLRQVGDSRFMDDTVIGIEADTPTRCSCYMCGNPRHHFGAPTKQELIAAEIEKEQIQELDLN